MTRSKTMVVGSTLLIAGGFLTPAFSASFHYEDYAPGPEWREIPTSIVIKEGTGSIFFGYEAGDVEFCKPEDEFVCFRSPLITFAIPQGALEKGRSWKYDGLKFIVLGELSYGHLGESTKVVRIQAQGRSGPVYDFLYSRERGLVAIDEFAPHGEAAHHYVIWEKNGFGVQPDPEQPSSIKESETPAENVN